MGTRADFTVPGGVVVGGGLVVDTTTLVVDATNNRVGIGTATPSSALSVTGTVTATTFAGSGASLTSLDASQLSAGTLPSARVSGAYTGITSVGTLGALSVTGTATAGTFAGSGASLTSIPAAQLTGTTLPAGIVSSSLTSVGTLGSLSVTGTVTAGTFSGSGASLTGVPAAAKWTTARTVTLSSHLSGSASVDGSADVSIAASIQSGVVTNAMLSSTSGNPGGTWVAYTPTITAGGTACTLGTGGTVTGAYVKVGKWVYAVGDIRFSTTAGAVVPAGNFAIGVPTAMDLFADSFMVLGGLRVTGLGLGAQAFSSNQPIGASGTPGTVTWRYPSGYPLGTDTVFSNTNPGSPIINQANAMRISFAVLYLSTT